MLLRKLKRNQVAVFHDSLLAAASFPLALYLRLGEETLTFSEAYLLPGTVCCGLAFVLIQILYRQYRDVWRYVSMRELLRIVQVATLAILLFYALFFLFNRLENVPRSVPFIQWMLLIGMLSAPRGFYRALHDHGIRKTPAPMAEIKVLLVGAGDQAEQFVRAMQRTAGALYKPVGMVDDDPAKLRRMIHNVPVLGATRDIRLVLRKLERKDKKPQRILITEEDMAPEMIQMLLEAAEEKGVVLSRLPRLTDFQQESNQALRLRPVDIEDVLGRAQRVHSRDGMQKLIGGKRVLITGAGGSIGSELVRQVAALVPSHLMMLDSSEYNLYRITTEMDGQFSGLAKESLLMDVRDKAALAKLFAEKKPEIIFHAAAIKHVPIAEENIEETILTNVMGTENVVLAASSSGAHMVVLISTDKAVNPTNIMGTTKRLAEAITLAGTQSMKRVAVRFGNVLGSTGSVVPLFQRQIAEGGPVTVTHPDIERYFMTIREAVELVIQAASMSEEDKTSGQIYVLDMGKPIKIVDLARQMIRLSGLRPDKDIQLTFTGLRPGEKLFEELFYQNEALEKTPHASIMKAAESSFPAYGEQELRALVAAALARDAKKSKEMLSKLVPEYQPDNTQNAA